MAFPQPYPRFRYLLEDGTPAVGYKLYSYVAGTLTPTPTFTDETEATENENPTILDSNGEAAVWLQSVVAYKLVLKADDDSEIWSMDSIQPVAYPVAISQGGTGETTAAAARDALLTSEDARTNSVADGATLKVTTSGTPAAGIGTGLKFQAESADESPSDVGRSAFVFSDVSAGSEDSYFKIMLRVAGAVLADAYRWAATTAFKVTLTHGNTADRVLTLPDATDTLIGKATTDTLTNKTLTSPTIDTPTINTPAIAGGGTLAGTLVGGTLSGPTLAGAVISGAAPSTPVANTLYMDSVTKGWVVTSGASWTILADLNVSSITDNGTGDCTINWATAFADANYAVVATASKTNGTGDPITVNGNGATAKSASVVRMQCRDLSNAVDPTGMSLIAIGLQ